MANLNSHPLVRAAYEACLAVEKLPASAEQTAAISAVSALVDPIEALALSLAETRRERDALRVSVSELIQERDAAMNARCANFDAITKERDTAVRRWERLRNNHLIVWTKINDEERKMGHVPTFLNPHTVLAWMDALEDSEGEP
jgi:hypothetical protein